MTIIPGKVIRKDKNWIDTGDGTLFSTSSGATALIHNTETGQMHRISFVDQSPVTESNGLVSFADHHLFTEFVYPKGGYTEGGYPDGREGQKSIIGKVLNTDDNWTHFGASDTLLADEHGAEALIYDEVNYATHKIQSNIDDTREGRGRFW